jgi:diguanylate cyclase (GGDEF)-like protein
MKKWKTRKQLEFLAYHDKLTGLYNRNYLEDYAEQWQECYITIIDIDNLKESNDKYGHLYGDLRIIMLAEILKGMGTVIRLGGDEFLLITAEFPTQTMIYQASYGTIKKTKDMSLSDAMGKSDKLMYENKRSKSIS